MTRLEVTLEPRTPEGEGGDWRGREKENQELDTTRASAVRTLPCRGFRKEGMEMEMRMETRSIPDTFKGR